MGTRKRFHIHAVLAVLFVLSGVFAASGVLPASGASIAIDGVKEAAWGNPLALDPLGDMSEPNLDLHGLYVVEDEDSYYIGFDAYASTWGMTYGIYLDTDQVPGSGATSDPWGRAVAANDNHLPEHTLYVWHLDNDTLENVQLNHWNGSSWSYDSLISQGGEQGYGPANDWIEYRVPKAALGNPARLALEVFTTGGSGHAQDTVPSDPNVAYTEPDWGGDITVLSAFALFPPSPEPVWFVRGDFNGWGTEDPMVDDGSGGDAAPNDGIFTANVSIASVDRYEFKIAAEDWSTSYPGSGNSWLETSTDGQTLTVTFDTNSYSDGWLPETNVIGVSTEPGAWTAVGDWQGWDNASSSTAMAPLGDGAYQLTTSIPAPGAYQYKAVKTGSWDAIGSDGRSVNAATASFETTTAGQNVTFRVDAYAGRVSVEVEQGPALPGPDNDIWWDGLGHDSRDDLYRVPGGAVTTGTPVTLRIRSYKDDLTGATLRVWSTTASAQTLYPMSKVATSGEPPFGYDYWQATIPAQPDPTILYYRFILRDGSDEDYYEDDDLFDGGWGRAYDDSPDYSFQIDVYHPDFQTPAWIKDAVIYQVFPDRFYNGNTRNDPSPMDPSVYGNQVLVKGWDELPEGYCRFYVSETCDEGPLGRDFYGGDLAGIRARLDYLQSLGVTALYLNPIFMAPSNHLYDTTDYYAIDRYFGTNGDYESLVRLAKDRGMQIILDGVFNHTSSDSLYFDRMSRYRTLGAYESQSSPYYDWYTFYSWPDSYNSWWGFDTLPVLTEIPAVRDFIYGAERSVATWWLKLGAAGWRLDVAPDKSHGWWQEFRSRVKATDPEAVILGEVWDDASPWLLGDQFDSTMNYRFRRALIGFVNGDTHDHQGFIRGLNPDQFNSVLQGIKEDYPTPAYESAMNLVGSHDTMRILWVLTPGERNRQDREFNTANLDEGKQKLKLLSLIQMTMPGAPTIYYGDEAGLTGDTDPDDRRPFPWNNIDRDLLSHYQTLTGLRSKHSFLRTGSFDTLYTHNDDGTYAYGRKDASGAAIVAVNRDTTAHTLTIDLAGYIPEGTQLRDSLNGGSYRVTGGKVILSVNSRWGAVLVTPGGVDLVPPLAPSGLEASAGDGFVDLSWQTVPDAAGYYVYRSLVSGGGYTRLNETPMAVAAFHDSGVTNGQRYYYVVTAVDEAGNQSERSKETSALPYRPVGWAGHLWPPTIEMTLSALDSQTVYAQVWVDGITSAPGQAAGILAQFASGLSGSDPASWSWQPMLYNVDVGNNDEYKFTFTPESAGTFDYLARFSTNLGLNWTYAYTDEGQRGSLVVHPSGDTTPPATPMDLTVVEAAPSFISLSWDPVTDPDLYRYEIYRADMSGGPYSKIADVLAPSTTYSDWSVTTGATYFYVVVAADTSFNKSAYSNEVQAAAQPRLVQVTFNATLPATTPDGDEIYMGGNFNGWDPAGTLMTRSGLTATVTLTFFEGERLEYKYTRGAWDYVEKGAACEEIENRVLVVAYGEDGTQAVSDTVINWRNTGTCGD
jgi:glycosidase